MIGKILAALQGRTTAFCMAFFAMGNVMHFIHRLDPTYISFMGILMGFVLGHSTKESLLDKGASGRQPSPPIEEG